MTLGAQTQRLQLPSPPAGHPTASNCFAWEVDGQVAAPSLEVTKTGSVHGKVKVEQLTSKGEISGEIDADTVELSGKVNDDTVIRAKTLEVKLENKDGGLQVAFGNCRLAVGDPNSGSDSKQEKSETGEREHAHAHVGRRNPRSL